MFTALNIATGQVNGLCQPRHRNQEFLRFLRQVARAYPDGELHLVMDNDAAHKRAEIRDWLAANPRKHVHFTPTSTSWMNLVALWFGIIECQAMHRGTFPSVRDLTTTIRAFIDGWNTRSHPFVWTKTADQILTKANFTHGVLGTRCQCPCPRAEPPRTPGFLGWSPPSTAPASPAPGHDCPCSAPSSGALTTRDHSERSHHAWLRSAGLATRPDDRALP